MDARDRWLLPEGIEEVLPAEAARLESLRRRLLDLFGRWGYELVIPPFIEYLDSLLTAGGHDLELQTFKLTDQLSGRLMGVRADMTPQVARMDAHALRREDPLRLCYLGTVLRAVPEGVGGSRSPLQIGAELYGHAGVESDAEVVSLMLAMLAEAGVPEVHLDLGHVGVFRGLMHDAGLSGEPEAALFDMLQRKARPELEQALAALDIDAEARRRIGALLELNGAEPTLARARERLGGAGAEVGAALDELGRIADLVRAQAGAIPLYYDLAELRGYHYHTGVVFAAYAPGCGGEVARGGRYDDIGRVFGRARPATGFSADLKQLLRFVPAGEGARRGIFAPAAGDARLQAHIARLRAAGERVVQALPGHAGGAAESGCDRELRRDGDGWSVGELGAAR